MIMPNVLARILTSLMLAGMYMFAYCCMASWMLACLIGIIGIYLYCFEFLPIAPERNSNIKYSSIKAKAFSDGSGYIHFAFIILINWALHNKQLLALTIILASTADIGAYTIGKLCGKHKLAPTISPGKTWEGFCGGWIATAMVLIGILIWRGNSISLQLLLWTLLFSLGSTLAGLLGDLYISKLKRAAGIKDTGSILPGHGGLLDRCDSILGITWYVWIYGIVVKKLFI